MSHGDDELIQAANGHDREWPYTPPRSDMDDFPAAPPPMTPESPIRLTVRDFIIVCGLLATVITGYAALDHRIELVGAKLDAHMAANASDLYELHAHQNLPGHAVELERLQALRDRLDQLEARMRGERP
mgnify:CR=1 FL=1